MIMKSKCQLKNSCELAFCLLFVGIIQKAATNDCENNITEAVKDQNR